MLRMPAYGKYVLILLLYTGTCESQSNCTLLKSCEDCIKSTLQCIWCTDPDTDMVDNATNLVRCLSQSEQNESSCINFESPQGSVNIDEGKSFDESIQLLPQNVSVTLRPGERLNFNLSIKPVGEFPLDVYFLMDFSVSMFDDLKTLNDLANNISNILHSISSDFTLGFGTFVDKPTDPFFDETCPSHAPGCIPTYGYRNVLSLTKNTSKFTLAINRTDVSVNRDAPEGGLDALLQATVCKDTIGWRPLPARHVIIYMSDAQFHLGGDGKIAGAVRPHDGKCHMNPNTSLYEGSLTMDYPSLSMIAAKLQEKSIFAVFAVTQAVITSYRSLSSMFPNIDVQEIKRDSSNLVSAIENAYYQSISSSVELQATALDGVNITFQSHCGGNTANTQKCTTLAAGEVSTFTVYLELTDCNKVHGPRRMVISAGIYGETVVNIDPICECGCSFNKIYNKSFCSGNGMLVCGLCECNDQSYGNNCQCTERENTTSNQLPCRNGASTEICSNHGECICAQCACETAIGGDPNKIYYGDFCECDNFNCLKDTSGQICSGHGICDCGNCACDEFYTGELCDCFLLNSTCREPNSQLLCSGLGDCTCGKCACSEGYIGEFCTICGSPEICGARQCTNFQECITCLYTIHGSEVVQTSNSCPENCRTLVHQLAFPNVSHASRSPCKASVSTGECEFDAIIYSVSVNPEDNTVTIQVEKSPQGCPSTAVQPWIIAVSSVVGCLLLVTGITIVVVIKVVLVVRENIEFKQFKREAEMARLNSANNNPLFNNAVQEFVCPLYGGQDEKASLKEDKNF